MRSAGSIPWSTSKVLPESRPIVIFFEMDPVIGPDHCGHGAIRPEQKRTNQRGKALAGDLDVKMHFYVRPRHKRSRRVGDVYFGQKSSSVGINGVSADHPVHYNRFRLRFRN